MRRFLAEAQADGLRCVAIVTGKGSSAEGGVLRRELPHWLNAPDLRPLLLVGAPLRVDSRLFNCAVAIQGGRVLGAQRNGDGRIRTYAWLRTPESWMDALPADGAAAREDLRVAVVERVAARREARGGEALRAGSARSRWR